MKWAPSDEIMSPVIAEWPTFYVALLHSRSTSSWLHVLHLLFSFVFCSHCLISGMPRVLHLTPTEQAAGKQSDGTWNMVYSALNVVAAVQQGSVVTSAACLYIAQNVTMSYHTSNLNEHQVAMTHILISIWLLPKLCWDLVDFQCELVVNKMCWGILIMSTFLLYRLKNPPDYVLVLYVGNFNFNIPQ